MDIDIDFPTSFRPSTVFPTCVHASMVQKGELKKHPAGIYLQSIPQDPITNLSAIPYKEAEELGFVKIDCLHLSLLNDIPSKQKLRELLNEEPDWNMLEDENVVKQLFQVSNHVKVLRMVKPTSVQELADVIALIRPGSKQLLYKYLNNRNLVRPLLYAKVGEKSSFKFKKAHAISYALTIVVQLNQIRENNA